MDDNIYKKFEINNEQKSYLSSKDIVFGKLVKVVGDIENYYIPNHFIALVNSVIYQAISFKAATTIWIRFRNLFDIISVDNILDSTFEEMRSCGLSRLKVNYIYNIAKAFKYKQINLNFENMNDKEVIIELTKIKGIGNWTAQMFLTFSLYRKDVMSYHDLAIRRGLEWLYKIEHELTKDEFKEYEKWFSPYNTIASLYLWEITLRKLLDFESIDELL